jgi:hypothetical protein
MVIAIPYFGDLARFRPLLDAWFREFSALKLDIPVVILSDKPGAVIAARELGARADIVDISKFVGVIRPDQPFDVKGAIVCAHLKHSNEPTLVLDADAVLRADPRPVLRNFASSSVAMPVDAGAIVYYRTATMDEPYSKVRKMCAGVMWFGKADTRQALVGEYASAWLELRDVIPWTPRLPHLLEQYAWSLVHHRRGAATLPHVMNWNERHLGRIETLVVNHDYGHLKWGRRSAPRNT